MGHIVTACVFCLLCAAHAQCSSHHDITNSHVKANSAHSSYNDGGGGYIGSPQFNQDSKTEKPDSSKFLWDTQSFVQSVFQIYGDGETITQEGFERMLRAMNVERIVSPNIHYEPNDSKDKESNNSSLHNHEDSIRKCVPSDHMLVSNAVVTPQIYKDLCPVLLYQFMPSHSTELCHGDHSHVIENKPQDQAAVWLYSTLSIVIISLCGLLGVAVIPVMQQVFYHQLIQFLVALAVGTLCGDALLHLLPHALMPSGVEHGHTVSAADVAHSHDTSLVRGLVAMMGVVFFYFTEKCLTLISEWGKRRQRKTQLMPKVLVMREADGPASKPKESTMGVEKKLCKHKYSSYPYCYGEIADNPEGHLRNGPEGSPLCHPVPISSEGNSDSLKPRSVYGKQCNGPDISKETDIQSAEKKLLEANNESGHLDDSYTIIIREHENTHHGHSHTHGHVHSAPQSLSSVAWMVVMGDGLHNFTDGMAIGAAFSSNIAGGFSTALAVFCHELPHELGDFAVLLKAGMSAKQAVFYNMLSSILCFIGMCFGVFLGHDESTTQWVFAAAAGMFLYIALVDMIPELTSSHSKEENSLCQCLLHFAGLMSGTGIMLLIAMYEHDLKQVFND